MIRPFRPEDAQACCDLICTCIRSDEILSPNMKRCLLENESPGLMRERARLYHVVVHESAGEIAGLGGIEFNEIRLLLVAPHHRLKGIGRTIVTHLESLAPSTFFADIFVYAAPGSQPFYRTLGYKEKGESVFDVGGKGMETVFMTKPIRVLPDTTR